MAEFSELLEGTRGRGRRLDCKYDDTDESDVVDDCLELPEWYVDQSVP